MARPQKCRCICSFPKTTCFGPMGQESAEDIVLGYDEYETLRLLDYEKFSQEQCAKRMNVSRPTVTRMYENARRKVADALVNGKQITISGGDVILCEKMKPECRNVEHCCHRLEGKTHL